MKKIIYLFTFITLILSACNPNEEIYGELDKVAKPYNTSVDYTLVAADYTKAAGYAKAYATNADDTAMANYISTFQAFNDQYTGQLFIPSILPGLFPAYNKGSIARITYNYIADLPEGLAVYATAEQYSLTSGDYSSIDSLVGITGYFYPEFNPDLYIPSLLASNITDATDGDIRIVSYKYSDVTPIINIVNNTVVFVEDFATGTAYESIDINGWTQYLEAGIETWEGRSYAGNVYAQFSAFGTGEPSNIGWLISPAIDLTDISDAIFNFKSKDGYNNGDPLTVLISTDYTGTGDPNSSTWENLNPTLSTGNTSGYASSFLASGDISLNDYCGGVVYIAFKYDNGGTITTTMQIDDINVTALTAGFEVIGENPITIRDYYTYDEDVWIKMEDVYYLTSADYDAMGAPGKYDNFSNDAKPYNYIPALLSSMYPLAGEGVAKTVVYKYYTGIEGTLTLADTYTYTAGEWLSSYNYIQPTTEQYIHNGDYWVFDPTVKFTMNSADYQLIVDNDPVKDSYGTLGYTYGASAYYSNFDLRLAKRYELLPDLYPAELSVDDAVAKTLEYVQKGIVIMLQEKYPNAVTDVSGIPVHYIVSYQTYNNDYSRTYYEVDYLCTESASGGTPATFVLQEGYPKVL